MNNRDYRQLDPWEIIAVGDLAEHRAVDPRRIGSQASCVTVPIYRERTVTLSLRDVRAIATHYKWPLPSGDTLAGAIVRAEVSL
jgi:hypothetical protein